MRPAASTCKVGTRHTGFVVKTRRSSHSNRRVKYWAKLPVGLAKPKKNKRVLKGGLNVRVHNGLEGEVHDVLVDKMLWSVVYDEHLNPTTAYIGDEAALQRGEFPPGTGLLNFGMNRAIGFENTKYNPNNRMRPQMSAFPPRKAFRDALVAMSDMPGTGRN